MYFLDEMERKISLILGRRQAVLIWKAERHQMRKRKFNTDEESKPKYELVVLKIFRLLVL